MSDKLSDNILQKVSLPAEELDAIQKYFTHKKIRKRQYLLNAGDRGDIIAFVKKGLLRAFSTDAQSHEHVVQFASEGAWISDMNSFLSGDEAVYTIEALEDSDLLLLHKQAMDDLMDHHPRMERYFRILMQNNIVTLHRRIVSALSLSAEEKYKRMLAQYPDILLRAPQQYVASYLGITPETLSRVRKQVASQK